MEGSEMAGFLMLALSLLVSFQTTGKLYSYGLPVSVRQAANIGLLNTNATSPGTMVNDSHESIEKIFNGDLMNIWLREVPAGDIRDIAVKGRYVFLLINRFNRVLDVLFVIDKKTGRIIRIWGVGRFDSFALASTEGGIWIATRSKSHFLRKISTYGQWVHTLSIPELPEGDLRGLGIYRGSFIFGSYRDGFTSIYRYYPESGKTGKMFQIQGDVRALTVDGDLLYAYREDFFTYANHWMYVYNLADGTHRAMRFINETVAGMDRDAGNLYCLNRGASFIHLFPCRVLEKENLIMANPLRRKVTVSFNIINKRSAPYRGDLWLACPAVDRYQSINDLTISPAPVKQKTDRFGNRWTLVQWNSSAPNSVVTMSFTATTVSAGQTLDHGYMLNRQEISPDILNDYTAETYCYDLSNYVIQSQSTNIVLDSTYLADILKIRDYVNNTLRTDGPDHGSSRSSFFLYKGHGKSYGHSLSLAALSRVRGVPARSVGGLFLKSDGKDGDTEGLHAWNQVYFPGAGWVDIDSHNDDNSVGAHGYDYIGYRSNRYIVTFTGDFDRKDMKNVFAENNWFYIFRHTKLAETDREGPVLEKIEMRNSYLHR